MFDRVNNLVTQQSFAMQAWDDRYSKGVWVALSPDEYALDVIRDLSSAGDLDMIPATNYILGTEWLPVVTGRSLVESMAQLEERLASLPPDQLVRGSTWSKMVYESMNYLRTMNRECKGYGAIDGKLEPLPEKYSDAINCVIG